MNLKKLLVTSLVLMILAVAVPLSSRAEANNAEANNTAVAQAWIDALNSRDPDQFVALFTEDAVYEDVTLGAVRQGLVEIRASVVDAFTAFPDSHFELVNSTLKGGQGTIEWVFSGTDTGGFGGTGKRFSVRGVSVVEVHGKKLFRERDYWDLATVLKELGLL